MRINTYPCCHVLHCMQSCSKAWEYYGFVSEKDQAYKDAAFYYDKAWKYSNYSSPALGKFEAANVLH